MKPEDRARQEIDRQLVQAGWGVQNAVTANLHASQGVAVREVMLAAGHGKTDYLQGYFNAEGKQTTNLASINLTKLGNLPVPIPPIAEQHRIVAEVDRRLSLADAAERAVEAGLAKAKRLRQAILKRAFEGKLVPQDPNDEPASVLLERIRAEREGAAASPSRGRSKRARAEK